jgi:4a-hydroxytetrahydrobiopterin dehydratase|tara:strand:+ start:11810 stop:12187 length:378 start_codon:yes stop_codon:yes gene_type:complete
LINREASRLTKLIEKKCNNCEKDAVALSCEDILAYLKQINKEWLFDDTQNIINRRFYFPIYSQTIAFVNAVAWIAVKEGHHPEMQIGYGYCDIKFTTNAIAALTENDFICAAKIDHLIAEESDYV